MELTSNLLQEYLEQVQNLLDYMEKARGTTVDESVHLERARVRLNECLRELERIEDGIQ